jgi:hypothetical protein
MATSVNPDPNTSLPPSCLFITMSYTNVSDMLTPDGGPSLDNVAPIGALSGDANHTADANPPTEYMGPIFGIDIPAVTPVGVYVDAVNLDITASNGNSAFTVSVEVTVVVAPEPAAAAICSRVSRRWRLGVE